MDDIYIYIYIYKCKMIVMLFSSMYIFIKNMYQCKYMYTYLYIYVCMYSNRHLHGQEVKHILRVGVLQHLLISVILSSMPSLTRPLPG